MGNREPSGVFGKEQVFGRKWVDMSLTLNPDICPQPTLQQKAAIRPRLQLNMKTCLFTSVVFQKLLLELPPSINTD